MRSISLLALGLGLVLAGCAGKAAHRDIAQAASGEGEENQRVAHLVKCSAKIDDEQSFTDFDVTPGVENKSGSRPPFKRVEDIRLKDGRVVQVDYRLPWLNENPLVSVSFTINRQSVLSYTGRFSRTENVDGASAENPKEKLRVECRSLKTKVPSQQPAVYGGNSQQQ